MCTQVMGQAQIRDSGNARRSTQKVVAMKMKKMMAAMKKMKKMKKMMAAMKMKPRPVRKNFKSAASESGTSYSYSYTDSDSEDVGGAEHTASLSHSTARDTTSGSRGTPRPQLRAAEGRSDRQRKLIEIRFEKLKNRIQHQRKQVNMEIEKLKNGGMLIEEAILRKRLQVDIQIEKLKNRIQESYSSCLLKSKLNELSNLINEAIASEEEEDLADCLRHHNNSQPVLWNLLCDDEPHLKVMFREGMRCLYSMRLPKTSLGTWLCSIQDVFDAAKPQCDPAVWFGSHFTPQCGYLSFETRPGQISNVRLGDLDRNAPWPFVRNAPRPDHRCVYSTLCVHNLVAVTFTNCRNAPCL